MKYPEFTRQGIDRNCRRLFLDSGAHSLYTREVLNKGKTRTDKDVFAWYDSPAFKVYLDEYAAFVKRHKAGIDLYVNVDVIFDPKRTWDAQKYLEDIHGLKPVPVIHYGTPIKWFERYLRAGYKFLGVGGLGQETHPNDYFKWADQVFDLLCPGPSRLPCVRAHGFAMTSYSLIVRYPWWSVDSASWAKAAAYGSIYVPHKRAGAFTFDTAPYVIAFSERSDYARVKGKHYNTLGPGAKSIVRDWLAHVNVPLGVSKGDEVVTEGVLNTYGHRGVANMRFFQDLCGALPAWPWPFKVTPRRGFFDR